MKTKRKGKVMEMSKEQLVYNKTKGECNRILRQIGVSWDDLPDTNSIWDWIDEDMSDSDIQDVAKDCCWDRLYDGGMDRDLATELIYGKEAV